jgi:putative RecB family exonuclease
MTVYSHSRLSTFETCPLQYKFKYIDKIKPLFENTIEAFMGSRVHDTLEKLYNDLKYGKLNTLQECLDFYQKEWDEKYSDDIKVIKEEFSSDNYRQMGVRFIIDYYETNKPFNSERHIECEKKILITLPDGKQIQGFIDRLSSTDDGIYLVQDYKTANTLPTQDYADKDRQLALYSIAIKELYLDCKDIKLVWHYLAFNKKVVSHRTDEELEQLKKEIMALIDKIEMTTEFEPCKGPLCPWCSYQYECPHFKHLFALQKQLDNPYIVEDDGVILVEKYAELKKKEHELKAELEMVQEALFLFAEKNSVLTVYGKEHKVRVWQKKCVKFPGKNDPLIIEIKKLLQSVGKFDEVAFVDTWELGKIVENKQWPDYILEMLKGFSKEEKVRRLYVSDFNK